MTAMGYDRFYCSPPEWPKNTPADNILSARGNNKDGCLAKP